MRGASDTDSRIGYNINTHVCGASEAMPRVGAQIHFMMTIGNVERLRQFAGP
jgi:hypothetical protein